jgi:hypothetical protein
MIIHKPAVEDKGFHSIHQGVPAGQERLRQFAKRGHPFQGVGAVEPLMDRGPVRYCPGHKPCPDPFEGRPVIGGDGKLAPVENVEPSIAHRTGGQQLNRVRQAVYGFRHNAQFLGVFHPCHCRIQQKCAHQHAGRPAAVKFLHFN